MTKQIPDDKLNRADGGFSLVEVIVSMIILALVTIPLLNYFMNSLQRSVEMAEQQGATLAAQKITEGLKATDQLFVIAEGESRYSVPYLLQLFGVGEDGEGNDDIDVEYNLDSDGKGNIIYSGQITLDSGTFDVRIKLSTDVAANEMVRPLIYGIDDTKDVLILERDQRQEALAYFASVNAASGFPLSSDEIEDKLSRAMNIRVDYVPTPDDPTAPEADYFTIQAYYDYQCEGLLGSGNFADGEAFYSSSTYLTDVRLTTLEDIYFLFDSMAEKDRLRLDVSSEAYQRLQGYSPVLDGSRLGLYLISQVRPEGAYTLTITGFDNNYMTVHTNIEKNGDGSPVVNELGSDISVSGLTTSGTPTRLIAITTEVFQAGHNDSDDALAVVNTTKGE